MTAIDEIKGRLDIVDVIGEQVQLQRAGRSFRARCPFHNERTPSFYVSPERQTWHCFGACGTGGDVFSYVMKRDGLDFAEALRVLAARAGVALEERRKPAEREADERLAQANEAAAAYYHHVLLQSRVAEPARAYLTQRGLDQETIEAFELGYSPESWDALKLHLTERGFSEADMLAAGLLVEGERGPYDRFRNRLMFPIRDERGRTVGFGGRALAESDGAKYLNTPQTSMFDKGGLLYALDRAKEAVRRAGSVIVVEGYMDAIAAHQQGITNVVASMGTALTERQIKTLQRLRGRILLALDADAAGVEATLRALQEAEAAGAIRAAGAAVHPTAMSEDEFAEQVREWSRDALKRAATNFSVVPLSGKDPDEMIRKDRAAWDAAVANAKPFTDHVFDVVVARRDLSKPDQRAELLQELLPVVRLIEEPVYRAHYVQRLARLARIGEDVVQVELRRRPARRPKTTVMSTPDPATREEHVAREPGAEFCLALLLRYPELRAEGLSLSPDLFVLAEHRAIYDVWRDTPDIDAIGHALSDELQQHLDTLVARNVPQLEGSDLQEALRDCVRRIGLRRLSHAKQASAAALADPDVQQYMTAAVHEAVTLQSANGGAFPAEDDPQASELAINLVKDEELGRKLHEVPVAARSAEASDGSAQGEVDS